MNTPTTFKKLLYSMSLDTWVVAECAAEVDALPIQQSDIFF